MFPPSFDYLPSLLPRTNHQLWYPSTLPTKSTLTNADAPQNAELVDPQHSQKVSSPWTDINELDRAEIDYLEWIEAIRVEKERQEPVGVGSVQTFGPSP